MYMEGGGKGDDSYSQPRLGFVHTVVDQGLVEV